MRLTIKMSNGTVHSKEITNEQELNVLRQSIKASAKNGEVFFQIVKTSEQEVWVKIDEISDMVLDTTAPRPSRVVPAKEEGIAYQDESKGIRGIVRPKAVQTGQPQN